MPFTLHNQVGVADASGVSSMSIFCLRALKICITFQYWVSVLLAIFGAATTIASRQ